MRHARIIARLDIKGPNLIKGIHLEGLRVVGDPHEHALRYYREGADELLFIDIVASLYQRNNLSDIIKRAANQVYVPITVGGGIRSLDNVSTMMHSGADKVAINTAAIPGKLCFVGCEFLERCVSLHALRVHEIKLRNAVSGKASNARRKICIERELQSCSAG